MRQGGETTQVVRSWRINCRSTTCKPSQSTLLRFDVAREDTPWQETSHAGTRRYRQVLERTLVGQGIPDWTMLHLTSFARLQHLSYISRGHIDQDISVAGSHHELCCPRPYACHGGCQDVERHASDCTTSGQEISNLSLHPSSWLCLHVKWVPTPSVLSADDFCPTGLVQQSTHTS